MKLIFWGVEIPVTEEQATQLLARYHGAQKTSAATALQQLKAGKRVQIAGYTYYPDGPWLVGEVESHILRYRFIGDAIEYNLDGFVAVFPGEMKEHGLPWIRAARANYKDMLLWKAKEIWDRRAHV